MVPFIHIIFIALAAVFKAVADTLKDHYDQSIFRFKDPRFWKPDISWQYVGYIKFTKYHPDAWHLVNSGMIISFIAAIVFYHPHLPWYYELPAGGILFNCIFNLFYNLILKRKP